jgi:uncharacterized protein involved in response to NO
VNRRGLAWYFAGFALLAASGALIGAAAISFLSSLTPLYASIALAVGAIVCAMVALARHVEEHE